MVLDASKESNQNHRKILERELESVGIHLNKGPPDIYFKRKKTGGIAYNSTCQLTKFGPDPQQIIYQILHEYKIHNAEVLFREDASIDDFIDMIEGNRHYLKCIYLYNKIDMVSIEEVDRLARLSNSVVISWNLSLNLDYLLERL